MEAEIDYLKSEIEAWKIREETSKKLYESMLKSLEDPSSQGVLVRLNQAQSVSEVKTLQERYTNECNALKISHSNTLRDLHETIRKLKEQTRELEFQGKNEKLGCQQQILDLQTEIFSLKAEVSALKTLQKASES